MGNNFTQQLKDQVKEIPLLNHDPKLWDKINSQLDFEDQLDLKIKELPLYNPHSKLWNEIEKGLDKTQKLKSRRILYISSIAASFLLLLGLYVMLRFSSVGSITITTEYESNCTLFLETEQDIKLQSKIEELCLYASTVCSSEEFIEIKNQLLELNDAINEVNTILEKYGESENLVKRLIVMENEKSILINNLLGILKS